MALGDVLDPAAGTALNCGLFHFGFFRPECWAYVFGQKEALQLANPDLAYPSPPAPAVPAPPPGALTTQTGAVTDTAEEAAALPGELAADAMRRTQAQNQAFFENLNVSLNPPGTDSGVNWWLWGGLIAAGVFGLAVVGGGSPRRYGR
jgi:hypothetical protein